MKLDKRRIDLKSIAGRPDTDIIIFSADYDDVKEDYIGWNHMGHEYNPSWMFLDGSDEEYETSGDALFSKNRLMRSREIARIWSFQMYPPKKSHGESRIALTVCCGITADHHPMAAPSNGNLKNIYYTALSVIAPVKKFREVLDFMLIK